MSATTTADTRTVAPAASSSASAPAPAASGAPREYLSFKLGSEEYGIDILRVQEIRGYEPPTRIANTQHFIKARLRPDLVQGWREAG
jgi:purine-binding chemotaxis protein CheW